MWSELTEETEWDRLLPLSSSLKPVYSIAVRKSRMREQRDKDSGPIAAT